MHWGVSYNPESLKYPPTFPSILTTGQLTSAETALRNNSQHLRNHSSLQGAKPVWKIRPRVTLLPGMTAPNSLKLDYLMLSLSLFFSLIEAFTKMTFSPSCAYPQRLSNDAFIPHRAQKLSVLTGQGPQAWPGSPFLRDSVAEPQGVGSGHSGVWPLL